MGILSPAVLVLSPAVLEQELSITSTSTVSLSTSTVVGLPAAGDRREVSTFSSFRFHIRKTSSALIMQQYLVRYGWQQEIAKVTLADEHLIQDETSLTVRGQRVVIDCGRGLEVGECLGHCSATATLTTGLLYRLMGPEDELLVGQLDLLAQRAFERCIAWLDDVSLPQVLLKVEPLMDGKTLVFHFLNDPDDEVVQEHMDKLVAIYEQEVRQSEFAQRVEAGCGPGCGTAKSSCQSSCSNCQTGKCGIKKTAAGGKLL